MILTSYPLLIITCEHDHISFPQFLLFYFISFALIVFIHVGFILLLEHVCSLTSFGTINSSIWVEYDFQFMHQLSSQDAIRIFVFSTIIAGSSYRNERKFARVFGVALSSNCW